MQSADLFRDESAWRVSFTFGHLDAGGRPVSEDLSEWARATFKGVLAELCGGGRISTDQGFYRYGNGAVRDETSSTIWSYGRGEEIPVSRLLYIAREVARHLDQESVLCVLEPLSAAICFISATTVIPEDIATNPTSNDALHGSDETEGCETASRHVIAL